MSRDVARQGITVRDASSESIDQRPDIRDYYTIRFFDLDTQVLVVLDLIDICSFEQLREMVNGLAMNEHLPGHVQVMITGEGTASHYRSHVMAPMNGSDPRWCRPWEKNL